MAKVLLSMPDKFLQYIDKYAEGKKSTRSELIREALRVYMRKTNLRNNQKATSNAQLLDSLLDD